MTTLDIIVLLHALRANLNKVSQTNISKSGAETLVSTPLHKGFGVERRNEAPLQCAVCAAALRHAASQLNLLVLYSCTVLY